MATHESIEDTARPGDDAIVVPLHSEELSIGRRQTVRGTVRVEVTTSVRDHVVDELLAREGVEIERIPVGRVVEVMPGVREEGDLMIIPVVEEVLVTERRLVLKEEIHLRRVRTTDRYQDTISLRTQDVSIARSKPPTGPAESGRHYTTT